MSFFCDICNNRLNLPLLNIHYNLAILDHYNRFNINLYIECLSSVDKHNFVYCSNLDHTCLIKYHTLKYVRIIKQIKYAYYTRIITLVGGTWNCN